MISIIRSVAFVLAASALATFAPSALATIIASDDFNYPLGELNTKNGGTGWANAWTANTGITQVVDPGVDLSDNRALQFTGNSNNAAYRPLALPFTGDVLFVDFLIQMVLIPYTLRNGKVPQLLLNLHFGFHIAQVIADEQRPLLRSILR